MMKKTLSTSILAASLCACIDTAQMPDPGQSNPGGNDSGDTNTAQHVGLALEQLGGGVHPGGSIQVTIRNQGEVAWDSTEEMVNMENVVIKNLDTGEFLSDGFSISDVTESCASVEELQTNGSCTLALAVDDSVPVGRYEVSIAKYVTDITQEPIGNADDIPRISFLVIPASQGVTEPLAFISSDSNTDFPAVKSIKVVNPNPDANVVLSASLSSDEAVEIYSEGASQPWGNGLSDSCYSEASPFSQAQFTVNTSAPDQKNYCYIYFRIKDFQGGEVGSDSVSATLSVKQSSTDQVLGNFNIMSSPALYVAGNFYGAKMPGQEFHTQYGGLVRWDGETITRVGELDEAYGTQDVGFDATINSMTTNAKGELYVGGGFDTWNGLYKQDLNRLAKWDGRRWSSVGGGGNGTIWGVAVDHDDNVYITGSFTTTGYNAYDIATVAKWDGSTWLPMREPADTPLGVGDPVISTPSDGIRHYMRGIHWNPENDSVTVDAFVGFRINTSSSDVGYIHQWNNQGADIANWNNMNGGPGVNTVLGVQQGVYGDKLACSFQDARTNDLYAAFWVQEGDEIGQGHNALAKWNGSEWSFISDGQYPYQAGAAAIDITQPTEDGSFYATGGAGGNGYQLTKWDAVQEQWISIGDAFTTMGYGTTYPPQLVVDDDNTLYAAVTTSETSNGASDALYRYDENSNTFTELFDINGWASVHEMVVVNEVKVELIQD